MDQDLNVQHPRVAVIMPVFNAENYLKASIDSILNQTFTDFRLFLIDDGSSDKSAAIIHEYNDDRIAYIKNESNIGVTGTLNRGLELCKSEYIARMDADDISHPDRFSEQVKFLDSHPEVGVCGTGYEIFGNETGIPPVVSNGKTIRASLIFGNLILHPSVMLRSSVLKENKLRFGTYFEHGDKLGHKVSEMEDFGLWHQLKHHTEFANINKVLLKYRIEGQNISYQKWDLINFRKVRLFQKVLSELEIQIDDEFTKFHFDIEQIKNIKDVSVLEKLKDHLDLLVRKNNELEVYDKDELAKVVSERWNRIFYFVAPLGLPYVLKYWKISGFSLDQFIYFIKFKVKFIGRRS